MNEDDYTLDDDLSTMLVTRASCGELVEEDEVAPEHIMYIEQQLLIMEDFYDADTYSREERILQHGLLLVTLKDSVLRGEFLPRLLELNIDARRAQRHMKTYLTSLALPAPEPHKNKDKKPPTVHKMKAQAFKMPIPDRYKLLCEILDTLPEHQKSQLRAVLNNKSGVSPSNPPRAVVITHRQPT